MLLLNNETDYLSMCLVRCQDLLLIFKTGLLLLSFESSLYIQDTKIFIRNVLWIYFLPPVACLLIFLIVFFKEQRSSYFWWSPIYQFLLWWSPIYQFSLWWYVKQSLSRSRFYRFFFPPMFSLRSFSFKFFFLWPIVTHFYSYVWSTIWTLGFWCISIQLFLPHLLKRLFFLHWIVFASWTSLVAQTVKCLPAMWET